MPRYFFTIHRQNRVENDPDGTYLPDAEAALCYADYTIRGLRKKSASDSDDDRRGSSPAGSFMLADFPWLLTVVVVASAAKQRGLPRISRSRAERSRH